MMTFEEILEFHGHSCPGIAMGYRMALSAMAKLNETRADDEEIVAIVENDACGVDALQCLTGCTFGKGNFIFLDYGKHVYTLFSRTSNKGVRVYFHGNGLDREKANDREAFTRMILEANESDIMEIREVQVEEPPKAQRRPSLRCAKCDELVMDTRTRSMGDETYCIPCADSKNE